MKIIVKLSFMSDFCLGIIDTNNTKHLKKINKQEINACSMATYKMVELMHARRQKERNRTTCYL